jgi:hypothetical protein
MIRPVFTELLVFLAPFVLYVIFLWAKRADVLHPDAWAWSTLAQLAIAALALVFGSFVLITRFSGAPPGSTYVPAHMENGKFVPGTTQ